MTFVPFLVLLALNKKLCDLVKEFLPNGKVPNKWVQVIAAVIGVALAFMFSAADQFGSRIDVLDGVTLDDLDAWGVALYGLAVSAGAGLANDVIERRNPDSAPDKP